LDLLPLLRRAPLLRFRAIETSVRMALFFAAPTNREAFFFAGALGRFFELLFSFIFASLFWRRFSRADQSPAHSHISQGNIQSLERHVPNATYRICTPRGKGNS
jgi:hypothetical protein